uniref:Peptidase A2 domain-containing protein n=1 Tax=Caenorhabditis japonica TaxID=281687 RepID=A0A8R1I4L5_CAEJA
MSVLAYEQPQDACSLPFLLIPMVRNPPLIALADTGAMCSLFSCAAATGRRLPVVAKKKARFNGIIGSQTIDAPVYHVQLGDRDNTEIFVKGFPGLDVKIHAPTFLEEDALALNQHGIDPRMMADLQGRHERPRRSYSPAGVG